MSIRVLSYLWFATLCISSSFSAVADKNTGISSECSASLLEWNEKNTIKLQPHQLRPIDYLEKNTDIKGLIINHYLGTGKTYLAIGFAERNPDQSIIILGPRFLKAHWMKHLDLYGVKHKNRYRFLSHDDASILAKEDLSNTIVIVDESHRFVEKVRSQDGYSDHKTLYFNLRNALRILALTGTPIYDDTADLIYQINLVAGKDVFSFNQESFRLAHSKINGYKSIWRGHLSESLTFGGGAALLAHILGNMITPIPFGVSSVLLPYLKLYIQITYPLQLYAIRDFDPVLLEKVIKQYVSYYSFDTNHSSYPTKQYQLEKIPYNKPQLDFLLRFYDSRLTDSEFLNIFKDSKNFDIARNTQYQNIFLNSSYMQNHYKVQPGSGREIGNLPFIEKSLVDKLNLQHSTTLGVNDQAAKANILPEKFKKILYTIQKGEGPAVVYSHYYHNGLLRFKQFLDQQGLKDQYGIFHPEMSEEAQSKVVDDFNDQKISILLLHPEITEGISLKGTKQFHFLEVPINSALQQQIIGRAVRYQSHAHLPSQKRNVTVYTWANNLSWFDLKVYLALRRNWHQGFTEMNYYGLRITLDPNTAFKELSPDTKAAMYLTVLDQQMEQFKGYVKQFGIESAYYAK